MSLPHSEGFSACGKLGVCLILVAACADDTQRASSEQITKPVLTGVSGTTGGSAGITPGLIVTPTKASDAAGRAAPTAPLAAAVAGIAAPPPARPSTDVPPPTAAGTASTPPPAAPAGPPLGTGTTCLKPGNGMYTDPGPYRVTKQTVDLGMIEASQHTGQFTIYAPEPLEASCLHPIVVWGNGTGVMGSGTYSFLNNNAASWGMVVAESHEDNTGSGAFHKAGIDYLLKQNEDSSSTFYKKLDTHVGVSGHSQGGFGASQGSAHPNVVTAAIEGAAMVATAKVSVLVLTGTEDIVMNPEALVTNAKGPMFVGNWEGGDHVTTQTIAGSLSGDRGTAQFSRLYAAWFRCTLGNDAVACKMFMGGAPDNCGICAEPGWHSLTSKNL